jgi:hypothetical protein
MKIRHFFVPVLDAAEVIPFTIRLKGDAKKDILSQDKVKAALEKFIDLLQKNFGEPIWYMGFDIIGEKYYERFLFDGDGFLEIMMEAPLAMNAHFSHEKRAQKFALAIKKTLSTILPKSPICKMLIENISASSEGQEETLTVNKWEKLKRIRKKA